MQARQNIGPLKAMEILNIQKKTKLFDEEQYKFRVTFKKEGPFSLQNTNPYEVLDNVNIAIIF